MKINLSDYYNEVWVGVVKFAAPGPVFLGTWSVNQVVCPKKNILMETLENKNVSVVLRR
jgi:hypothetical protein